MHKGFKVLSLAIVIASLCTLSNSLDPEEKYKKGCKEGKYSPTFGCTSCLNGYYIKVKYDEATLVKGECGSCFYGCISCTSEKNCAECKEGLAELKQNKTLTIGPA